MYKDMAKALTNMMRSFIHNVMSKSQSTFVKGRQISYWIAIANELVNDAKKLKEEMVMFKVDFEKTYDSIE